MYDMRVSALSFWGVTCIHVSDSTVGSVGIDAVIITKRKAETEFGIIGISE
jgi:hypothetical protein